MRVFTFVFLVVLSLIMLGYFNVRLFKSALRDKIFEFGPAVDTLVLGDSHPMSSLNPAILKGSVNLSLSEENYFFTYYKLKHFLNKNPQIRNLVLGFSYHNISKIYEEAPLFSEDRMKESLDTYYILLDREGKITINSIKTPYIENYIKYDLGLPFRYYKNDLYLKALFARKLDKNDFVFFGNYYNSLRTNLLEAEIEKKVNKYFFHEGKYGGTSALMIEYLTKIIDVCRNKGIKVYLYNAPLHPWYKKRIPLSSLKDFNALVSRLVKDSENVVYLDYVDLHLDASCFGDGDHVNFHGAKIVSVEVERILEQGRHQVTLCDVDSTGNQ